ncbi:hypothetical protein H2O64_08345 [Kordia sp. YSTF-M3]|uniref:XRE family transcriptional regulator n=1 Tax=Kordia aestuariivivens TaxID=2759037 RepID=A0ABR7Q7Y9_9FLAO|nr:hypothetical protein [Kordia aestuariivivens]MBC8754682.1 hypothetical protein [Kordia aestuariivivens]
MKELDVSGYKIQQVSNGLLSQVSADKIKNSVIDNPREKSLKVLTDILCTEFNVSREWLTEGTGEMLLESNDSKDIFLEKLGVRFELIELVDHFVKNKEDYYSKSEYLKLFIDNLAEQKIRQRLIEFGIIQPQETDKESN